MKKVYVASLGLPKGFPIMEYDSVKEIIADGGDQIVEYGGLKMERLAAVANSYMHQKGPLVTGRSDLAQFLTDVVKFPRKTVQVTETVDNKPVVKTVTDPKDTEAVYIGRFIADVAANRFTTTVLKASGKEPKEREDSLWNSIQELVEKPYELKVTTGDKTEIVKLFDLKNSIKAPIRTQKPKAPPAYALDAATNIITNKNEKKWTKTFTDEGVPFEPFVVPDDVDGNKVRLAWAIQAREALKAKKEYA